MTIDWQNPEWRYTAHGWIDDELGKVGLTRTGEIDQPHIALWSTVMRVPTDAGDIWFKANMDALRHEAALTQILAQRVPDTVPPLLAFDSQTGWMLMPDAGVRLRDLIATERSLDRWLDVLRRYAAVQLALVDEVDALLAAGVPDLRLAVLPEKYARLVGRLDAEQRFKDAVPLVTSLCDQLAAFGIAETIQHDDLHDGQVFLRDDRHLVMDWGDACISHPFFTLSVTLEGVISWGVDDEENSADIVPFRDAYLEPFGARYDGDLAAAVDIALRLGWACRVVNGHVNGDEERTLTRLRMFLDGRV